MSEPRPQVSEWTGILGGSFDPVHLGHLAIARLVRRVFSLRRVLLMPCAVPPHKPRSRLSAAEHRLEMLRLAVRDEAGIEVSTLELDRGGISYTIDTLRQIGADPSTAPLFILGMDALAEIATWKDHRELLHEFDLVVLDRPTAGETAGAMLADAVGSRLVPVRAESGAGAALLADCRTRGGAIFHLIVDPIDISASRIRDRVRRGESLGGLVPFAVARYIRREGLFSQQEEPR